MAVKILIVDDSKTVRLVLLKALQPYDCVVSEACDGAEGLAAVARERPDLILLDLSMPVMDGERMLKSMRAHAELKSIPIILVTSEADAADALRVAKLGVWDVVVKPFREDDLLKRVATVVPLVKRQASAE